MEIEISLKIIKINILSTKHRHYIDISYKNEKNKEFCLFFLIKKNTKLKFKKQQLNSINSSLKRWSRWITDIFDNVMQKQRLGLNLK
ncbi:unnamed protein product [Paramecium pentaurelia]|uniref:Uncharacterized protein n=1 Tax=Paramecium pentaurelia TaxID=43138 RepID=A0A8S1UP49_9CILI|nr:unnamed protein product [Paramecium pentaurelia]